MKKLKNLWIIIPGHNEEKNIGKVIEGCKRYTNNVVVVDDGSKDNTSKVAEKQKVIVLRHLVNLGKGAALKTGCDFVYKKLKNAKEREKGIIVVIDSDGQHDPKMIPVFVEKLKKCDIVFGVRKFGKTMPFVFRFGNRFINYLIELLFHVKLRDTQCGYRGFHVNHYKKLRWLASDYSMESEMIANVGANKLKYMQIPVETIYTDDYKGTTIVDGVRIVYNIIKWRIAK